MSSSEEAPRSSLLPEGGEGRAFFRNRAGNVGAGDIREGLQHLSVRQKDFEKYLAGELGTDALGLETMYHLISLRASTPTALAHSVGISTAAMTLVLGRLEAAGHIRRAPHPSDRRKVVITADPATEALAYRLVTPVIGGLDDLIHALDDHDRAVVERFLGQATALYRALTPSP